MLHYPARISGNVSLDSLTRSGVSGNRCKSGTVPIDVNTDLGPNPHHPSPLFFLINLQYLGEVPVLIGIIRILRLDFVN